MKNTLKMIGIIAFAAVIGFSFAACEGPTGPTGPAGKNGINGQNGQQGPAGPMGPAGAAAFELWDSSTPSKKLGVFVGHTRDNLTSFISTSGYIIHLNWLTAEPNAYYLYFPEVNQTGTPMFTARPINTAFYNPHSGGTWYLFVENAFASPVTGYKSGYTIDGDTSTSSNATGTYYKLQESSRAEVGMPEDITPPLVLKFAE